MKAISCPCPEKPVALLILISSLLAPAICAGNSETLEDCQQQILNNDFQNAERVCRQAAAIYQETGDADRQISTLFKLIDALTVLNQYDAAFNTIADIERLNSTRQDQPTQYKLHRKTGAIHFHRKHFEKALTEFQQGLTIALASDKVLDIGKSYNDIGTTYRSQGLFEKALENLLKSQHYKARSDDLHATATTINNIGNLYRDMSECADALQQYEKAIESFRIYLDESGDRRTLINIAHTQENIGLCQAELDQPEQARSTLRDSLSAFSEFSRFSDQIRLLQSLAKANLQSDRAEQALVHLQQAAQLATDHNLPLKAPYFSLTSSAYLASNDPQTALTFAKSGLTDAVDHQHTNEQATLLNLLSQIHRQLGQHEQALDYFRQFNQLNTALIGENYTQDLARLKVEHGLDIRESQIESLNKDIQIQRLSSQLSLTVFVTSTALLLAFIYRMYKNRKRQQKEYLDRIAAHQQAEKRLRLSEKRLSVILDTTGEAILAVNQKDHIVIANQSCVDRIGVQREQLIGRSLEQLFPDLLRHPEFGDLTPQHPEVQIQDVPVMINNTEKKSFQLSLLLLEEGIILISIYDSAEAEAQPAGSQSLLQSLKQLNDLRSIVGNLQGALNHMDSSWLTRNEGMIRQLTAAGNELDKAAERIEEGSSDDQYRMTLVQLMQQSLEVWQQTTGLSQIDLAEQSGIWRINIDEGRLRTRSMDRYLNLNKLPKYPRWREVLRTVHFVMAECELSKDQEQMLSQLLNQFHSLQSQRV